jgi:hypothetical protein
MRLRIGFCFGLSALGAMVSPARASWGNKLWNDGRAEVAVYDSECVVDGTPRAFREHLLVVKEALHSDTLIKADDPKAKSVVPVFELQQQQTFDVGNYPRHVAVSAFVKEDDTQKVVKISAASQDWVGTKFMTLKTSPDGSEATLLSYSPIDGQGDKTSELAWGKDDYMEDALPLSLRALPLKDGYEMKIKLWPAVLTSTGDLAAVDALVSVSGPEDVRSHAGTLSCWVVAIKKPAGTDTYWFEKKEPHVLIKMETADGRKRLLYGRARWSYWDKRLPRPNILK